jgi:ESCRT-II complex subunit VPS22
MLRDPSFVIDHSAQKGFWAELLGVGDFYYEVQRTLLYLTSQLGIQILEICFATRSRNGGLMDLAGQLRLVVVYQ